jgi:hypothetical protein
MKALSSHLPTRLLLDDLMSSGISAAMLLWRGRRDAGSAAAPINAVAHWLWPRAALRQDGVSARFTATGLGVHFAAALLWCGLYERLRARPGAATPAHAVGDAVAVAAVAAVVDLACVPDRLTPGFEKRLSARSLVLVYAGFAAGLSLGGLAALRR